MRHDGMRLFAAPSLSVFTVVLAGCVPGMSRSEMQSGVDLLVNMVGGVLLAGAVALVIFGLLLGGLVTAIVRAFTSSSRRGRADDARLVPSGAEHAVTLYLGDVDDAALRVRVRQALRTLDAAASETFWGTNDDSKEVVATDLCVLGKIVRLEARPEVGIVMKGPEQVVQRIRELVLETEGSGLPRVESAP